MAVWIIGDTHLSADGSKPMDVFGPGWADHQARLAAHWEKEVGAEDCVIIAGDISWAMHLEEALEDLRFLHGLPGRRKILLRGNHDYWWGTKTKVMRAFEEAGLDSLQLFQNEAVLLPEAERETLLLLGTRGWLLPSDEAFTTEDEKILRRERIRLELSVKSADKIEARDKKSYARIAVMHYPPLGRDGRETVFSSLLEDAAVRRCYYGHVHGAAGRLSFNGSRNGIEYRNIAADRLAFRPERVDPA